MTKKKILTEEENLKAEAIIQVWQLGWLDGRLSKASRRDLARRAATNPAKRWQLAERIVGRVSKGMASIEDAPAQNSPDTGRMDMAYWLATI